MNYGMSRTALNESLQCEKASLPQPNILPASYKEAKSVISPLLMAFEKYDACMNDCIVYRDTDQCRYYNLNECPVCSEPRKTRSNLTCHFHHGWQDGMAHSTCVNYFMLLT